jgi:ribA/ribD-fused uncharacterized protein
MTQAQQTKIASFSGQYRFLSNFSVSPVMLDGFVYPTVECAYQAAKTLDAKLREPFVKYTSGTAKKKGRELPLRENWDAIKNDIMLSLLIQKFEIQNLRTALLATGDAELVEGNWWHDVWFGVCTGNCKKGPHKPFGENWLGKLLMQVREEIVCSKK